ncbi:MAG: glycosyltransferase [Bacteroidales bacterium]
MNWLAYFIFAFLVLRLMVSLTNLLTRQWLKSAPSAEDKNPDDGNKIRQPLKQSAAPPLISVLIPARNEEQKIGSLLNDLLKQDYENTEILVYDDLSEDQTPRIVREFMNRTNRLRLLEGIPLPGGWLGKNHACHVLAKAAKGEYLLFLDSDVRISPTLLTNSLAHMKRHRLDLLSVFPEQEMRTFGEKITVPIMNWVLIGLLPLILTRISAISSFSAANGQFMLFRADIYRRNRFHEKIRNIIVEDIEIFRLMKKKGLRTHTVLSNGEISCRMYGSWNESIEGFSRNVSEFFGGSIPLAILFALITTLGIIPVFVYLPAELAIAFVVLLALHRIIISFLSRQPVIRNLLLAPLQQLSFCAMIIRAVSHTTKKDFIWKGRKCI